MSYANAIAEYVDRECSLNGYASITSLPLGSIPEENYELSEAAIQAAIYSSRHWSAGSNNILPVAILRANTFKKFLQHIGGGNMLLRQPFFLDFYQTIQEDNCCALIKNSIELLPYIPAEKIAWSLSMSSEFVWVSEGKYFLMKFFRQYSFQRKRFLSPIIHQIRGEEYYLPPHSF